MYLRINGSYQEAWESYRHEVTDKPTSRRVARWPRARSLEEAIRDNRMAMWRQLELSGKGGARGRKATKQYARLLLRNVALNRARLDLDKSEWLEEPLEDFEKMLQLKEQHAQSLLQDPFVVGEPAAFAT